MEMALTRYRKESQVHPVFFATLKTEKNIITSLKKDTKHCIRKGECLLLFTHQQNDENFKIFREI